MTHKALEARKAFLENAEPGLSGLFDSNLSMSEVMGNVESFIGSVSVPLGLIGPLTIDWSGEKESVFGAGATTEGALIASINRGCRAIASESVVTTEIQSKCMTRMPMFAFSNAEECARFVTWFWDNESEISAKAEEASNHAELLEFEIVQIDETAHVKFVYDTGDASGQNMTTACTWHACVWVFGEIKKAGIELVQFGIEGNGASDKKVSEGSIENGRGIRVESTVTLSDDTIKKFLRVDAQEMYEAYVRSERIAEHVGMVGFNSNVVNAIAAIFTATGQDIACVGESGTGILNLTRQNGSIRFELVLTNLVIGTVGGGTALPTQNAVLRMMGCAGTGKVERFASIIAGFSLALELSTLAAVVGGQFARAHQVFGRNKPKNWLVRSEFDQKFVKPIIEPYVEGVIQSIDFNAQARLDNGILTDLSAKVVRKMVGFTPMTVHLQNGDMLSVLAKSKALDSEIIKGIHYMASQIDTTLADKILATANYLEYRDCHLKEIEVFRFLDKRRFNHMPRFYGSKIDEEREVYLLFEEMLNHDSLTHFNSELSPESWTKTEVVKVVDALVEFQELSLKAGLSQELFHVAELGEGELFHLYTDLLNQCKVDRDQGFVNDLNHVFDLINQKDEVFGINVLCHNDFNPRNIAIRSSGELAIYDWELAFIGSPLRDMVEFLSFVVTDSWSDAQILEILELHRSKFSIIVAQDITFQQWSIEAKNALKFYIAGRVTFYLLGESMLNYGFSDRIFKASMRMLKVLS